MRGWTNTITISCKAKLLIQLFKNQNLFSIFILFTFAAVELISTMGLIFLFFHIRTRNSIKLKSDVYQTNTANLILIRVKNMKMVLHMLSMIIS